MYILIHNLENAQFEKKCPKIKKYVSPLMTTFYKFALKIGTSWAKKVVNLILEIGNVSDFIVFVWFIYSWIKKN